MCIRDRSHGLPYILITDSPYFYLALTLMILGTQLFLAGFIGCLLYTSTHDGAHPADCPNLSSSPAIAPNVLSAWVPFP